MTKKKMGGLGKLSQFSRIISQTDEAIPPVQEDSPPIQNLLPPSPHPGGEPGGEKGGTIQNPQWREAGDDKYQDYKSSERLVGRYSQSC